MSQIPPWKRDSSRIRSPVHRAQRGVSMNVPLAALRSLYRFREREAASGVARNVPMSGPQGFFQRKPIRRAIYHWLERHQHPFNRGIHMIGIPLVLLGVVLVVVCWDEWYWGPSRVRPRLRAAMDRASRRGQRCRRMGRIKRLLKPVVAISLGAKARRQAATAADVICPRRHGSLARRQRRMST